MRRHDGENWLTPNNALPDKMPLDKGITNVLPEF